MQVEDSGMVCLLNSQSKKKHGKEKRAWLCVAVFYIVLVVLVAAIMLSVEI